MEVASLNQKRIKPTVSVQFTREQIEWLEERKWTHRRSFADVVRDLVDRAMADEKVSNDSTSARTA